jgi:hypothetical protein
MRYIRSGKVIPCHARFNIPRRNIREKADFVDCPAGYAEEDGW